MKKTILVYCHSLARFPAVLQLVNSLHKYYDIKILLQDYQLSYVPDNTIILKPKTFLIKKLLKMSLIKKIKNSTLGMILHELLFEIKFQLEYTYVKKLLLKHPFDVLITLSDRHTNTFEYTIMKCAKRLNKKIFIPYFYHTNPEGYLQGILGNHNFILSDKSNYYEKYIFNQFHYFSHKQHHVYRAFLYRVFKRNNVLSKNPWVLGAGLADMVAVSNAKQQEEYTLLNPDGCYPIIGDFSYQTILDSMQNNQKDFFDKYHLDNKKILIVSLGQFYELNFCSLEENHKIICHILDNLLKFTKSYNILISFHPSMNQENYKFISKYADFKIITEPLNTYIHLADIFIAHSSATVLWSTLLGIKTIILNYNYGLDFFSYLSSPIFVTKSEELEDKLTYTICEYVPNFEQDWKSLSKEQVFNSHTIERYVSYINTLIPSNKRE